MTRPDRLPIRVADLCNLSSSANALLRDRVLAMRAQGLDNRILCQGGRYVETLRADGVPVEVVTMPRGFRLHEVAICFVQLFQYFRRERIDLVHTHFSVPGFIGRLAARLAGVPVIVHTIHGFPFHPRSSRLQRAIYVALERSVGGIADLVLSQNRGNIEDARRYRIVPSDRLRYIGNGIQLGRFQPTPRQAKPGEPVTILCVARLEWIKNHELLFQAVRRLVDRGCRFRLQLVGQGELRAELGARAAELGIDHVLEFLGYRDDVPALQQQADIAVLTSIKEGVPRAVLEAMAMALPVVATRIPGTVDAVRDGETGYTVPLGDADALAARLEELAGDPELRARMGARGREVALGEFDENAIIAQLAAIYRGLLLEKGVAIREQAVPRMVGS